MDTHMPNKIPSSRAQPESMQRAHARITTRLNSTRLCSTRGRGRGRGRGRQPARQSVRGRDERVGGGHAMMWTRIWMWCGWVWEWVNCVRLIGPNPEIPNPG
uniref:HDC03156 n=1 Tax=Drosophila melanogaster TaxID=7227 RepID=Q6IH69_DROME|nr:TPA_inf: HDC03156 [Drosophila melanogaster]